ncbi:MAG: hypothetical protein ABEJ98_00240 [Candidatus Nanohaloarchaea archaeon]
MEANFLKSTLAQESRAYGFTIAFWGSGAMLIKEASLPTLVDALSYGGGAVLGFAALTLLVYGSALKHASYGENEVVVLGMVHYIAALVPIALSAYLAGLPAPYSFLLSGFAVSTVYNLGMVAEEAISEEAEMFEQKFL